MTYTFTATNPGTYSYHSGTSVGLQVDMGLVGAIIVRPAGFNPANPTAYGHADSQYTYENLFLLTEMDVTIHNAVQAGVAAGVVNVDTTTFFPAPGSSTAAALRTPCWRTGYLGCRTSLTAPW